jgi:hypothetical protein
MPYDANLPADHAPIVAVELRNQFNGLNDLSTQQQNQIADLYNQVGGCESTIANLPSVDAVNAAITAQSAANVNSVAVLSLTVSNPPTQAQMQAVVNKLNELITAMHRA